MQNFCGKFAETTFHCARKGCGNSAESLQKFRGNLRNIFCNDPFPNDPISELLKSGPFPKKVGKPPVWKPPRPASLNLLCSLRIRVQRYLFGPPACDLSCDWTFSRYHTNFCQRPHLFLGFKMSKSRGREEKLRQNNGRKKKEEKTWKHEKNPHIYVFFFAGHFLLQNREN